MAVPGISFEIVRSSGPVLGIRADRGAMLALTERGPEETPTLVHSHDEFVEIFGSTVDGMLGPLAAQAYYDNGGAELVVARIVPKLADGADGSLPLKGALPAVGSLGVVGASVDPSETIDIRLRDRGAFGNRITVEAILQLRRRARGTITATNAIRFDNLLEALFHDDEVGLPVRGLATSSEQWGTVEAVADPTGPSGAESQIVSFGVRAGGGPFFPAAGGPAVVELYEPTFTLRIREPGRADVVVAGLDLSKLDESKDALAAAGLELTFAPPGGAELPAPGIVVRLAGGTDGLDPTADPDVLEALRQSFLRALQALELSELPDIVFAPDLWSRIFQSKGIARLSFDAATAIELADEMVRSAERARDRVVLVDPPLGGSDGLHPLGVTELESWRKDRETGFDDDGLLDARDFAATYTPWVRIAAGPVFKGDDTLVVPPSSFVAGQMARTSRDRGPWVATGNIALEQVVGLEQTLSLDDEERLQNIGINPLRMSLPRGATIQGVRALSWPDRKPWRFLSTRRLFNFLRRAVRPIGLSYVFEPNSHATWITLRRDIDRLLREMYARGAFAGTRPEDAFFIKIDDTLNPEDARNNGVLTAQIGVAPAFPLEFLVVRLVVGRSVVDVTEEPILR